MVYPFCGFVGNYIYMHLWCSQKAYAAKERTSWRQWRISGEPSCISKSDKPYLLKLKTLINWRRHPYYIACCFSILSIWNHFVISWRIFLWHGCQNVAFLFDVGYDWCWRASNPKCVGNSLLKNQGVCLFSSPDDGGENPSLPVSPR